MFNKYFEFFILDFVFGFIYFVAFVLMAYGFKHRNIILMRLLTMSLICVFPLAMYLLGFSLEYLKIQPSNKDNLAEAFMFLVWLMPLAAGSLETIFYFNMKGKKENS
jgi:hypothetical protein